MKAPFESPRREALYTVLSYLLSAVTGAVGLLNWVLLRQLVLILLAHSAISRWAWRSIDEFSFLAFGMLWLSAVLFSQYYYRSGAKKKRLWEAFSLMTGIQMLLLFVCQAAPALLEAGTLHARSMLPMLLELSAGVLLFAFRGKWKKVRRGQRERPPEEHHIESD